MLSQNQNRNPRGFLPGDPILAFCAGCEGVLPKMGESEVLSWGYDSYGMLWPIEFDTVYPGLVNVYILRTGKSP